MKPFQPKGETFFVSSLVSGLFTSPRTRTFFSICFLMLLTFQTYAQDGEWKSLTTIDGIEIQYQKAMCDDAEVILLWAKNTGDSSQNISLTYNFVMEGESVGSGDLTLIELAPQAENIATCETGLRINVYDHLSIFDESLITLTITKSQN